MATLNSFYNHLLTSYLSRSLAEKLNSIAATAYEAREVVASTEAVLDHAIPSLNSTLSSLRALVSSSATLLSNLRDISIPALQSEFTSQISELEMDFDKIENERIAGMAARVQVADQRVKELSERVKKVRKIVEDAEENEREEAARRRKRIGIVWGIMGFLVALWVISVIVRNWPADAELERKKAELALKKIKSNGTEPSNLTDIELSKENRTETNWTEKVEQLALGRVGLEGKGKKLVGPENHKSKANEGEGSGTQKPEEPEEIERLWRMFDEL